MDNPAPGILLIADPFLKDPNFKRSVVFLCEHQSEGSFGFLLNKTYEYSLKDLVQDAEGLEIPVYFGGPVQTDTIHFLHQYPDLIQGGYEVIDGIYWGGNFELLKVLVESNKIDPRRIRFIAGYCGWLPDEFTKDLKQNLWWVSDGNKDIVFDENADEAWGHALSHMGNQYAIMSHFSEDPNSN